ncbi:MAG: arsenate reductase (glutaredoxin) [Proteobacteria bacterium]|nr:arsenate reductase (glutaredoxin) [Pseudomonadota bacterium]
MITLYHNPRCSKSREALQLVQTYAAAHALDLQVIDYQLTPLTLEALRTLRTQLGDEATDMVRDNEEAYATMNLAHADIDTLLQAVAQHPRLLQRPIAVVGTQATIGRPPEKLSAWLAGALSARRA